MDQARHLLEIEEPAPFTLLNAASRRPVLLLCDHASDRLPAVLGDLGMPPSARHGHLAVDIGAAELTRRLASALAATAILAGYSRLAVDLNREPEAPSTFLEVSDGIRIPGNHGLSQAEKRARLAALFVPYHAAVEAQIERLLAAGVAPVVLAIHSFTPVFEGYARPWEIGILWDRDARVPAHMLEGFARAGFRVGDNQPYSGRADVNYTVKRHAASAGLAHACIEVRQDLLQNAADLDRVARTLLALIESLPAAAYAAMPPRAESGITRHPGGPSACTQEYTP